MVKKFLSYAVIILILAIIMWYQQASKPHYTAKDVLGSSANLQLLIQPGAGTDPIVQAIDSSKKDVLVEDYLLSDKDIITALEQAKQRGIDVQVMLEQHPFGGGNLNPKAEQELEGSGVAFEWTDPSFTLTHEKTIIIDDHVAIIMSQNLTAAAFKTNREYDIIDYNPQDVAEADTIFHDDWQRSSFSPTQTDLVISPNTSRGKLEALINSATQSIDLTVEDIDDKDIMDLLETKAKSMPVELLIPTIKQLSSNQTAADQLQAAGVQVHTISSPYMHGKMILVDSQRAYVGSINYSTQSIDQNRELGIIVSQADIIQQLNQTFQTDWTNSESL